MKSFKSMFIFYYLLVNVIAFFYLFITVTGQASDIMLLEHKNVFLIFSGIGGNIGVLLYEYFFSQEPSFSFGFHFILWGIFFYQCLFFLWAIGLFSKRNK